MTGKISDNLGRSSGLVKAVSAGAAGAVDWDTTPKTATVTAVSGNGYFVNTAAAVRTVNLPAGSAGAIVAIADYTRTFNTNNCTVSANGSEKIGGVAQDAKLTVDGQSATFVYVDATEGWINVQETETSVAGLPPYTVASGGTESTSGDYKIHIFTGPGTFAVSAVGSPAGGTDKVSYLAIAGGASGAGGCGGGGGAGGFREAKVPSDPYTDSPLDAGTGLAVTVQDYPITVGAGGAGNPLGSPYTSGTAGSNSIFSSITATGGGYGGGGPNAGPGVAGGTGGSGGGGHPKGAGGAGNTPPTSPAQGFAGGSGTQGTGNSGGGGGGASAVGTNSPGTAGGTGGAGVTTSITATPVQRAGGGGGAWSNGSSGCNGGAGGGGLGGFPGGNAVAGTTNTGSGGGAGGAGPVPSGAGGSGLVVIRYKYQN